MGDSVKQKKADEGPAIDYRVRKALLWFVGRERGAWVLQAGRT